MNSQGHKARRILSPMYTCFMVFDGVNVSKIMLDIKGFQVYYNPMLFDGF